MTKIEYIGKCLLVETKRKKILVIGDLHFGYDEAMRTGGVMLPNNLYDEIVNDMEKIFDELKGREIDEIVLLGDLKHQFGSISGSEWNDVLRFIDYLSERCKKIVIIKGNHDKIIDPIARKRGIEVKEDYIVDGMCFLHGDNDFDGAGEIYYKRIKCWIMGHGHPAVTLREKKGVKTEKYKCYLVGKWKGKEIIIVPSFFPFNEGSDARDFDLGLAWEFGLDKFNVKVVNNENLKVLDF